MQRNSRRTWELEASETRDRCFSLVSCAGLSFGSIDALSALRSDPDLREE